MEAEDDGEEEVTSAVGDWLPCEAEPVGTVLTWKEDRGGAAASRTGVVVGHSQVSRRGVRRNHSAAMWRYQCCSMGDAGQEGARVRSVDPEAVVQAETREAFDARKLKEATSL